MLAGTDNFRYESSYCNQISLHKGYCAGYIEIHSKVCFRDAYMDESCCYDNA